MSKTNNRNTTSRKSAPQKAGAPRGKAASARAAAPPAKQATRSGSIGGGRGVLIGAIVLVGAIAVIVALAGNPAPSAASALPAGVVQIPDAGGVQRIAIAANNAFLPGEIAAKAGVPIELEFGQGSGCAQAVKLPDLGIEQPIAQGGAVVKLGPVKAGNYDIFCQSNMDMGTLYVR